MPISPQALRPALPRAIAWRLLTELQRRHGDRHRQQIVRAHPGNSPEGQLLLMVEPERGRWQGCPRVTLNLGGPTGTFEVQGTAATQRVGDFLHTALTQGMDAALATIEDALGWRAPATLPKSSPRTLAMRLVAELLAASWLDRDPLALQHAWFDSSLGCDIRAWASDLGLDREAVATMSTAALAGDAATWDRLMGAVRLVHESVGSTNPDRDVPQLLVSLHDGVAVLKCPASAAPERIDLRASYSAAGRRLEPLAAQLLAALRQATSPA